MKEQGLWGHFDSLIEDIQRTTSGSAFELYTKSHQDSIHAFLQSVMDSPKVFFPSSGIAIQTDEDVDDGVKKLLRLPYPTTVILTDNHLNGKVVVVAYDLDVINDGGRLTNSTLLDQDGGIGFSVAVTTGQPISKWALLPVLCVLYPRKTGTCGVDVLALRDDIIGKHAQSHDPDVLRKNEENLSKLREFAGGLGTRALVNTCVLLNTHNTTQETIEAPKALNQKRAKKGKRPLLDYKILVVDGERWDSNDAARAMVHGDGSGVRSHLRRGHIRHLVNGKIAYVRATYVHGSKEGFIEKDYFIGDRHAIRQQA